VNICWLKFMLALFYFEFLTTFQKIQLQKSTKNFLPLYACFHMRVSQHLNSPEERFLDQLSNVLPRLQDAVDAGQQLLDALEEKLGKDHHEDRSTSSQRFDYPPTISQPNERDNFQIRRNSAKGPRHPLELKSSSTFIGKKGLGWVLII